MLLSGRLVVDDRLGRVSLCLCFLCGVRQHVGVLLDSPYLHLDLALEDQEDLWQVLQDSPLKGILFVWLSGQVVLFKHMYHGGCWKQVPLRFHSHETISTHLVVLQSNHLLTQCFWLSYRHFAPFLTQSFSLDCQVSFRLFNALPQCPCGCHSSPTLTIQNAKGQEVISSLTQSHPSQLVRICKWLI